MASSRLRAFLVILARLTFVAPVGRFVIDTLTRGAPSKGAPSESAAEPSPNVAHGLQVIACGMCRSGTLSLKLVLDRLGFKCYHSVNVFHTDPEHAELWVQAAKEANFDKWEDILEGYGAITGFLAASYYKKLMVAYPNAKVILNLRDPERWHRSCMDTLYWMHNLLFSQIFDRAATRELVETAVWQGRFEGRFAEKEFAISVYRKHVEDVKRVVPKEKLLVYEAKQGWSPLCEFLQVDTPDTPFPDANDSKDFRVRVKMAERLFTAFSAVYIGLLSSALALLLKRGYQIFVAS